MNTNEFYKQLMSEYTFDDDKIRKAAMGEYIPSRKKRSRMVIGGLSATAAAVVAAVGIFAAAGGGNPVSVTPSAPYSEQQRFELAAQAYEKAEEEDTGEEYFYVTFNNPVTADDMQDILLSVNSEGTIKVISVYLDDKSMITGRNSIQELFGSESANIDAVKIMCPANLYRRLQDNEDIYLAEKGDTFPEDDFTVPDTAYVYEDGFTYQSQEQEQTEPQTPSGASGGAPSDPADSSYPAVGDSYGSSRQE